MTDIFDALHLQPVVSNRPRLSVAYKLELALQKAVIELEYAHSKLGADRSLTRAVTIAEAKRALRLAQGNR